ncbi:hypothetical protein NE237_010136 [Protea cynaroides]|uniref:Uncharacterized protein n=1 Tax=Protea cynaroides TaxID=273540 RepID=A0A9Q0KZZ2_9MAGN|nr:hypothetical protein NE237_010136 [Protea cynaroides]
MEVIMAIPQAMLFDQKKGTVTEVVGSHQGDLVDGGKGSSHVRFTCRGDGHRGSPSVVQIYSVEDLRDSGSSVSQGNCGAGPRSGSVTAERFLSFGGAGLPALTSVPDGDIFPRFGQPDVATVEHQMHAISTHIVVAGGLQLEDLNAWVCQNGMRKRMEISRVGLGNFLESPFEETRSVGVRAVARLKFKKAAGVFIGDVEDGFAAV